MSGGYVLAVLGGYVLAVLGGSSFVDEFDASLKISSPVLGGGVGFLEV